MEDRLSEEELDTLARSCANRHLRQAARIMTRAYDRALGPVGLKSTQFSLLAAVSRDRPRSITELASALGLERSTLSRNLKLLEKEGLIRVSPEGPRRARTAEATSEGRARLRDALPYWKRAQGAVVRRLGPARFLELRNLLADLDGLQR